jgi:hypothetical protein
MPKFFAETDNSPNSHNDKKSYLLLYTAQEIPSVQYNASSDVHYEFLGSVQSTIIPDITILNPTVWVEGTNNFAYNS